MKNTWLATSLSSAALVLAAACSQSSSPAGAVKQFYGLLDAGKVAEAVKMINLPPGAEPKVSLMLGTEVQREQAGGGLSSIEIVKEDIQGDTATVAYKIHLKKDPDSDGKVEHMNMAKANGQWKFNLQ